MLDWVEGLEPEEQDEWHKYVEHFRRETLEKMSGSSAFISVMPADGKWDVKFATELGAAIILGKPILALAMPGADVPEKLRTVADKIVYADIDTEEGRVSAGKQIAEFLEGVKV